MLFCCLLALLYYSWENTRGLDAFVSHLVVSVTGKPFKFSTAWAVSKKFKISWSCLLELEQKTCYLNTFFVSLVILFKEKVFFLFLFCILEICLLAEEWNWKSWCSCVYSRNVKTKWRNICSLFWNVWLRQRTCMRDAIRKTGLHILI